MTLDYEQELKDLFEEVIHAGGSDLHLSSGRVPHIRVAGELIALAKKQTYNKEDTIEILKLLVSKERVDKFLSLEEIDFSYDFEGKVRFRGNAYFQRGAASIALRAIQNVRSIRDLNLPEVVGEFSKKKQGFFLVVGPVGSGKSTTLASMIDLINKERKERIVTIEDPIEYVFEEQYSTIDQREVGIDSVSFESALASVFRQDVNVIMIGEMRDPKTISTAVTAAETGHLVLSTLHTNTAAQTVDRIIDSFPASQQAQIRTQLAGSLLGIFSQRLIPKVGGGVIPAYELLVNNNAVSNLIREARTHEIDAVIETGLESGMIDMNRSLIELVRAKQITLEDAYRFSTNPRALERMI